MVGVAQLAELQFVELAVAGSSPVAHPEIVSNGGGVTIWYKEENENYCYP